MIAPTPATTHDLLKAISQVVGPSNREQLIRLHEPDFKDTQAWTYVKDCLDTGWVSTTGSWVSRFEKELSTFTGAQHVIAVSNGTVALRLALYLVGVKPDDEVMIPSLSFVATANAVAHLGAYPHFVDVNPLGLGLSPNALRVRLEKVAEWQDGRIVNRETGRRIAAVLPVHVFGHPADMNQLRSVADDWKLPLIEDAAEALGSFRNGTHCGLFGSIGIFSFNGNKLVTTGGGGALITNDCEIAKRARHLSTTAKKPHPWNYDHDAVGWNDRLPNINAALGVAQLEDLPRRLQAKRQLHKIYAQVFADLEGVELLEEPCGCQSNFWMVSLRFITADSSAAQEQQLKLLQASHKIGILLRPIWTPLHQLPIFYNCPSGKLPVTENQASRIINLPSSPQLFHKSSCK